MTGLTRMRSFAVFFLFFLMLVQATESAAADPGAGYILIYGNNQFICRLPIEEGQTDLLEREKGCKVIGFTIGSFELEGVRSAVTITLSANRGLPPPNPTGCINSNNFTVTLRTAKNNLTTSDAQGKMFAISTEDLSEARVGMPIIPGLIVKHKYFYGTHDLEIRCVKIQFD